MQVMVILAHPYEKSFNAAIYDCVADSLKACGHAILCHDLYSECFDPIYAPNELATGSSQDTRIIAYQNELLDSDGLVIVHPNWWGQPPAILKGWIDRVLLEKIAYKFGVEDQGGGIPQGLFCGKKALVFNTSNTAADREKNFFGDPLDLIWKKCIFEFCGITDYCRKTFSIVADSTEQVRKEWLCEVRSITTRFFPENR